jgi:hypothetical protein
MVEAGSSYLNVKIAGVIRSAAARYSKRLWTWALFDAASLLKDARTSSNVSITKLHSFP